MTFGNAHFGADSMMALFTDTPRMHGFLGDSLCQERACVGSWNGQSACNAATHAELPLLYAIGIEREVEKFAQIQSDLAGAWLEFGR